MAGVDAIPRHDVDDASDAGGVLDPRRWLTLVILITAVILIAVDTSVLNVSIPTILRDMHTTVPSLQWVITGYSLTFATLLIIGGRLGDVYGHRRLFIIGVTLFGLGSLLASESRSVGMLILGEAVIEGVGAALMTPATLAILSTTFRGRERATAFAAWGAAAGAAVAFGPVLGGFLTTNYSWRWSFRINVVVAPLAVLGAITLMPRGQRKERTPIDIPGAAMIAFGMFLMVFALSDGGTYGWFTPIKDFSIAGARVWPESMPIGVVPVAFLVGVASIAAFVVYERAKERREANPLFEFSMMGHRSFRYGLLTLGILAMGQLGVLLALPLFLQDAVNLTALQNGLWLLPLGVFVILGAQAAGRLVRVISATTVVRAGLLTEASAIILIALSVTPSITFLRILPGLAVFGIGLGLASSQLTSVILSEVAMDRSGVASAASSTARQMGAAFGAAVIGSVITVQTTNRSISATHKAAQLSEASKRAAIAALRADGPNYSTPKTLSAADASLVHRILTQALADGSRIALLFAFSVVLGGALLSFLIPRASPVPHHGAAEVVDTFELFEPMDPDPTMVAATD